METSSGTPASSNMTSENNFEKIYVKQEPTNLQTYKPGFNTSSKVEIEGNHTSAYRYDILNGKSEPQDMQDESRYVRDISVKIEPKEELDTELSYRKDHQDLPVKCEAGDSETAGCGVDGRLLGSLMKEDVANLGIYCSTFNRTNYLYKSQFAYNVI